MKDGQVGPDEGGGQSVCMLQIGVNLIQYVMTSGREPHVHTA